MSFIVYQLMYLCYDVCFGAPLKLLPPPPPFEQVSETEVISVSGPRIKHGYASAVAD